MTRRGLTAAALVAGALAMGPIALGADYPEIEPNNSRAAITEVGGAGLLPGDAVTGITTGSTTTAASTDANTVDYHRIKFAALTPAPGAAPIWKSTLTANFSAGTGAYPFTVVGYSQSSTGIGTSESTLQTAPTTATPRVLKWYSFGQPYNMNVRMTGSANTSGNYALTYDAVPVTPVGTVTPLFSEGPITISTMDLTPAINTDFWVYDSNGNPFLTFGNNDNSTTAGGTGLGNQSLATRELPQGTYYIAISNANLANNQPNPADERILTNAVLEWPGAVINDSATTFPALQVRISDNAGNSEIVLAPKNEAFEVAFVKFVVGPPQSIQVFPGLTSASVTPGLSGTLVYADIIPATGPNNTITLVTANLAPAGGSATQQLFDDGTNGDVTPGDGRYSFFFVPPAGAPSNPKILSITGNDANARQVSANFTLNVIPGNDDCGAATVVSSGFTETRGINLATNDTANQSCATNAYTGVWYSFTPAIDGLLEMRETTTLDVNFATFQGSCNGLQVQCESTETDANLRVFAGVTYYILAYRTSASTNINDSITVSFNVAPYPAAPAHSDCSTAFDLTGMTTHVATYPAAGALPAPDVSCNASALTESPNAIWLKYTATVDTSFEIAETDSAVTGYATAYAGGCAGTEVACKSLGGGTTSRAVLPLNAGQTYYILVSRSRQGALNADYDLNILIQPIPVPNRSCATASEITSFPYVDSRQTIYSTGYSATCDTLNNVLWYKYTADHSTVITYAERTTVEAGVIIFRGTCAGLEEYRCDTFSLLADAHLTTRLDAGYTYYFAVYREFSSEPSATEQMTFDIADASILAKPPANDFCSNAERIGFLPFEKVISHPGATPDFRHNCRGTGTSNANALESAVWYRYTNGPDARQAYAQVTAPDDSPADTSVAIYSGSCPTGDLQELVCSGGAAGADFVTFTMLPNTTYYIQAASNEIYFNFQHAFADESLRLRFDVAPLALPTPVNSTCSTAKVIGAVPYRDVVFTENLPSEVNDVSCNAATAVGVNNAIWYTYTTGPSENGFAMFSDESNQDAIIAAYTGCGTGELRCAGASDTGVLPLAPGTTYHFLVGRFADTASTVGQIWDFNLRIVAAPSNDTCATATPITSFPVEMVTPLQDALGNSLVGPDTFPVTECFSAGTAQGAVWYSFIAHDSFILVADELGPVSGTRRYALYRTNASDPCNTGLWTAVGCGSNSSTPADIDFIDAMLVTPGDTYMLMVGTSAAVTNPQQQFYRTLLYTLGSDAGRCSVGPTCEVQSRQNCVALGGVFTPGGNACRADFSCSSGLNIDDIFIFLNAWFAGDTRTDWDLNGVVNIDDIFIYLNAWFAGCPA